MIAVKDVTIEPEGTFCAELARDTEAVVYAVSGTVTPVWGFSGPDGLTPGTLVAAVNGRHAEYYMLRNKAPRSAARVLQAFWRPYRPGLPASTSTRHNDRHGARGLVPVVVPLTEAAPPATAALAHQRVRCWAGALTTTERVTLATDESLYVLVVEGQLLVEGEPVANGDGAVVERAEAATLVPTTECAVFMMAVPLAYPGQFHWDEVRCRVAE